jgi:uroporphyrinogen decarboxylase
MNETMTSRERVTAAINHEFVDRMPIDLGGNTATGISAFAYHNLRKYLGLDTNKIAIVDPTQFIARVDDDIRELFHIDTIFLAPQKMPTARWNVRGDYTFTVPEDFMPELLANSDWQIRHNSKSMTMPVGGYFFDGDWTNYYNMDDPDTLDIFTKRAEEVFKETDKFTIIKGFSGFFHGIEFACQMLLEPEECKTHNEMVLANQIARFDEYNRRMGKFIQAIDINDDLGMQTGPMISPACYEEFVYPYLKRFCEHVHATSDLKIFMHSCGSIYKLLPYIVDSGVNAINPVQITAADMEPARLKSEFGDKICFWGGGCNTQQILGKGTPEEVAANAKQLIDIFSKDSGYVFCAVHNIMGDVPPENIVALYNTAINY